MIRPSNIPNENYEDDYLGKGMPPRPPVERAAPLAYDADTNNGRLLRTDPVMRELFRAYCLLDAAGRDELVRAATAMIDKKQDMEKEF